MFFSKNTAATVVFLSCFGTLIKMTGKPNGKARRKLTLDWLPVQSPSGMRKSRFKGGARDSATTAEQARRCGYHWDPGASFSLPDSCGLRFQHWPSHWQGCPVASAGQHPSLELSPKANAAHWAAPGSPPSDCPVPLNTCLRTAAQGPRVTE